MYKNKVDTAITIASIVLIIILLPIFIFNMIFIVKSFLDTENVPDVFGYSPLVVLSGSMSPEFETNSLIIIKDVELSELKSGDVICYLQDGYAITHRIFEVIVSDNGYMFITKGDANSSVDMLSVSAGQIQGKYLFNIPNLGGVVLFMQTPTGLVICVGVPILAYFMIDMCIGRNEKKKQEKDNAELKRQIEEMQNGINK